MDLKQLYNYYIYKRYYELVLSGKQIDNYDLCKIFEWYVCVKLTEEYDVDYYEYNDIDSTFKEDNCMSRNDTGIDASNMIDTIVQCKLRKNRLTLEECATFFASQNIYDNEHQKPIIRWEKMMIARNSESIMSKNLEQKLGFRMFIDKKFDRDAIISYCQHLLENPPVIPECVQTKIELRDYQIEAIEIIKSTENSIICLPTGCGKNIVIIHSFEENKKYLILVPRIILMDQLQDEIIKYKPQFKDEIECVGDGNSNIDSNKKIYICVYNSIGLLGNQLSTFDKIYIDEAHHIYKPMIYQEMEDEEGQYLDEEGQILDSNVESQSSNDENQYLDNNESQTSDVFDQDSEDELRPDKYMKIIHDLSKYKNNVYLSATIDQIDGFVFYKKDIRDMIEKGYLCDYNIHIPIFDDDPTNKNICEHLVKNYRNTIIYCNSQKQGQLINELMNQIQPNCCQYIDCNTPRRKRVDILNNYKKDKIPFLVNVKILVEGFDAPITKSIVFLHLPSTQTTLIQIIGRALRLHDTKRIASIILPFSSVNENKNINNFMRVMAKNDKRIMKSYVGKKLGGYINVENLVADDKEVQLKYTMIYNSIGELVNGEEIWYCKLQKVKEYIDLNGKRPSQKDKAVFVKKLGQWLTSQTMNYKKKLYIMSTNKIRTEWSEFINSHQYKEYFVSNEESWYIMYQKLKKYIDINSKLPPTINRDENARRLGMWLSHQKRNYKKKLDIMSDIKIYNEWSNFINSPQYKQYFISNQELWYEMFRKLKGYIDINHKKPLRTDKNLDLKKLGSWLDTQIRNYKKKLRIMSDDKIYHEWTNFINSHQYRQYFTSNEEIWYEMYVKLKEYININGKKPPSVYKITDANTKRLRLWLDNQVCNYKKKSEIMSNDKIYNEWTNFVNSQQYGSYFVSNEEIWYEMYEKIKEYMDINGKRPSDRGKNPDIKRLCQWLGSQIQKYKKKSGIMSDDKIYNEWTNFITSPRYKQYFISNEESWYGIYEKLKEYINLNNKKPSDKNKDQDVKRLGMWLRHQIENYKKRSRLMSNPIIYNEWREFITSDRYKNLF